MNGEVRNLLYRLISSFSNKRVRSIKKINDRFISLLVREPCEKYFALSVLTYVLAKICTKPRFFTKEKKVFIDKVIVKLREMNDNNILDKVKEIESIIIEMEERDPRFIFDLFTKARVKTAAILYAKGISLGRASKITGIPKQEILSYAGKTMMFDRVKEETDVIERIKEARHTIIGR